MIAVFQISHSRRGECRTTLGIGDLAVPDTSKRFDDYNLNGGNQPFPANKLVLDLTEFEPYMTGPPDQFFLKIFDGGSSTTGVIDFFSIEKYEDYGSGVPVATYVSTDPPVNTLHSTNVYAHVVTGVPGQYAISGHVKDATDTPVPDVTMRLSGASTSTTTTNTVGFYCFAGLVSGNYTVTPEKLGWTFDPVERHYLPLNSNQANQDYLATAPALLKVIFCATPTMACPDATFYFEDDSEGNPASWLWDFGDRTTSTDQNPAHRYWKPGKYDVSLTIANATGSATLKKEELIWIYGYGPKDWASLVLLDHSQAFSKEPWDNAIDGDISCWDGTVTARGEPPFAIFEFEDGSTKSIHKVRLLTDTGVDYESRWVRHFQVLVATTGLEPADFVTILDEKKLNGDWEEYTFAPVAAKYIKLVIIEPDWRWRQLGEFQVCPVRNYAEPLLSKISVTSPHIADGKDLAKITIELNDDAGEPITGLHDGDFCCYATPEPVIYYPITETENPGVYTTTLGSIIPGEKDLDVIANGIFIGTGTISFIRPELELAPLVLVKCSQAYASEGWDNAIDGDITDWDGTVTAKGTPPYAIFGFADGTSKSVQKFNLLVDTGVGYENRWVSKFRLMVSTTGLRNADFVTIYNGSQTRGDWQGHVFPAAVAKYVKFIINEPSDGWRQLGEIEVMTLKSGMQGRSIANNQNQISLASMPAEFSASANYPNPFNPITRIDFTLPEESHVEMIIYNILGQKVRTLVETAMEAGYHTVTWDGTDAGGGQLPGGTYYLRLYAGKNTVVQKMVLLK